MSPSSHYKEFENKIVYRIGKFFKRIGTGITSFFTSFFDAGRQKFTVMLIPHSEKKVLNFRISVFALVFMGFLLTAILGSFILFTTQFSGVTNMLSDKTENLSSTQSQLDILQDEIADIREKAQSFEASLTRTMENLSLESDEVQNDGLVMGDLTSFFNVEEQEEGVMRELSDLLSLGRTMEESVKTLEQISEVLVAQGALLVEMPTYWPIENGDGRITALFGPAENPFTHEWYLHKGLDIGYGYGKPILAAANGKVIEQKYDPTGFGNYILIRHKYGFQTKYAHLQRVDVKEGDVVTQGQVLGLMGSSGLSTGPHLHFEVRIGTQVVDPERFLDVSSEVR
ncbi:MAG: M23 family metallopeptidase [Spirochaetales bacterium]|nr:M23 family metallopeptidase [Spirochaetales bacterium]